MKITHICLAGPVTDGWSYQENELAKYHRLLGNVVSFITSQIVWGNDGKLKLFKQSNYINSDGIKMIRLPQSKNNRLTKFKRFDGLFDTLLEEKPNLVFIHCLQFLDINSVIKYIKIHPKTIVYVDNHSDFSNSATNWFSKNILHKIIWKHYAKEIEPFTTKFYGVLPARVDFLIDLYKLPKEKVELLVMGADDEMVLEVNEEHVRKSIRAKHNIRDDEFLIMTGGKIDSAKKQTLLLMKAVQQIKDLKVKLIIFGSVTEELKHDFDSFCYGEKVKYIGWIKSQDSYKYFAATDLVIFPGRHSVFWEQVTGQGIPMICKYWYGTTHVDVGGNVRFLTEDSVEEIQNTIEDIVRHQNKYNIMKAVAMNEGKRIFSYKDIARRSIEGI